MVDAWTATQDADKVYDSVDSLAAAWHASMAALTAMPEFHAWQRSNPAFKQLGPIPVSLQKIPLSLQAV